MRKVLFITNGHGEDMVADRIIKYMPKGIGIDVLPVVGRGGIFERSKVNIIGPRRALPGGGFGLRNFSYLIKDIFYGLIGNTISQIRILRKNRGKYDLVVGIGDIVPIIYSVMTKCPFIFVGVNKSEYYKKLAFNYTGLEKRLLKKYCRLTLTRDEITAKALKANGINAKYTGNPMMDMGLTTRSSEYQSIRKGKEKNHTIGFLPGTREDAYKNIEDFYNIAWEISRIDNNIKFLLSFPSSLSREKLARIPKQAKLEVVSDFNKVLSGSNIIIGLSGTGNEQSAGVGLPVIAFPGRGAQFNYKFALGQKELLGGALMLLPRNSQIIARETVALLDDQKKVSEMGREGKKRMGKPGASKKIASTIRTILNKRK